MSRIILSMCLATLAMLGNAAEPIMSRQQAELRLIGQSQAVVIRVVGRPNRTSAYPDLGTEHWYYSMFPSYDPISGQRDMDVLVVFVRGRVGRIAY